jgi:oxygen-dependent protoporphyrinogen oxidase
MACTAHVSAKLLAGAAPELSQLLGRIEHSSAVTVMFGFKKEDLKHPLNGFGFLVPRRERKLLLASTWVDTKFDGRATARYSLIRCFAGHAGAGLSDSDLTVRLRGELAEKMGVAAEPAFVRIRRWPESMPQYAVGHAGLVASIKTQLASLRGLHLAGNAYEGFGIPDCVRMGREVAGRIAQT